MKVSIEFDERYPEYIVTQGFIEYPDRLLDLPEDVVLRFLETQSHYDATKALEQAMIAAQPGAKYP